MGHIKCLNASHTPYSASKRVFYTICRTSPTFKKDNGIKWYQHGVGCGAWPSLRICSGSEGRRIGSELGVEGTGAFQFFRECELQTWSRYPLHDEAAKSMQNLPCV